jgi:hypothetical protein
MAQRYTDAKALEWMANDLCPECGQPTTTHGGWGAPRTAWARRCSLTDNGVADRIAQYQRDQCGYPLETCRRTDAHDEHDWYKVGHPAGETKHCVGLSTPNPEVSP